MKPIFEYLLPREFTDGLRKPLLDHLLPREFTDGLMKHIMSKRRIVGGLPPKGSKLITHNGIDPDRDSNGGLVLLLSSRDGPAGFQRCKDQAMCMGGLIICEAFDTHRTAEFFRQSVSKVIEKDSSALDISQVGFGQDRFVSVCWNAHLAGRRPSMSQPREGYSSTCWTTSRRRGRRVLGHVSITEPLELILDEKV